MGGYDLWNQAGQFPTFYVTQFLPLPFTLPGLPLTTPGAPTLWGMGEYQERMLMIEFMPFPSFVLSWLLPLGMEGLLISSPAWVILFSFLRWHLFYPLLRQSIKSIVEKETHMSIFRYSERYLENTSVILTDHSVCFNTWLSFKSISQSLTLSSWLHCIVFEGQVNILHNIYIFIACNKHQLISAYFVDCLK